MGSPHFKVRIKYENIRDATSFYELLCVLEKRELTKIDSKLDSLGNIIGKEPFDEVSAEIHALFEFDDESPCFWNTPTISQNEIHFEVYGSLTETEQLVNIITNTSIVAGIVSYYRIDYTTSAEGINFYWIREYHLFHYYEDQRTFEIFVNWRAGFEESVRFIVEKHERGEIHCSHCSVKEAAGYVSSFASYNIYDYLISAGMFNYNEESKGLRGSSDDKSNKQKRQLQYSDSLKKGIENLFK